jgi:hypothetical protein
LLLSGPNLKFTSGEQFLARTARAKVAAGFTVAVDFEGEAGFETVLEAGKDRQLDVVETRFRNSSVGEWVIRRGMTSEEVLELFPADSLAGIRSMFTPAVVTGAVVRERCFLEASIQVSRDKVTSRAWVAILPPGLMFAEKIHGIIHLPGLRGNPERAYPRAATGPEFFGTFEQYTASVIAHWAEGKDGRAEQLEADLRELSLTSTVTARPVDGASIEIQVGRLPCSKKANNTDLVNIADVGFGVSQTLPVLVALLVAKAGQLVYIEQPEIHLHPRAQVALAGLIANAARRGVRVVIETHSSLLLLGVQRLVAEGKLPPGDVRLHWFNRDERTGATAVTPGRLDDAGRFNDWPADFDDVAMTAQFGYLNASQEKLSRP